MDSPWCPPESCALGQRRWGTRRLLFRFDCADGWVLRVLPECRNVASSLDCHQGRQNHRDEKNTNDYCNLPSPAGKGTPHRRSFLVSSIGVHVSLVNSSRASVKGYCRQVWT